uniref:Uncharacterized protein n=1 Tax=Rhipicephalus appendiculatus TaxID=34631 RepID=A0A131YBQ1_RHIAP
MAKLLVSHMVISCRLQENDGRQLLCSCLCGRLTVLDAAQGAGTLRQLESSAWQLGGINEHLCTCTLSTVCSRARNHFGGVGVCYCARFMGYVLHTCTPFLSFPKNCALPCCVEHCNAPL